MVGCLLRRRLGPILSNHEEALIIEKLPSPEQLGRKVGYKFTAPLAVTAICQLHHCGNEAIANLSF
jgi:hypothetical protein